MSQNDVVVLGRVTSVYGVKGWVKVFSETEPMQGILDYHPWLIRLKRQDWRPVELADGKRHGKGLIVRFAGCEDRDAAVCYCGAEIAVPKGSLPELAAGEYYWHQLEDLKVLSISGSGRQMLLGKVDHLLATGGNDVLVVKACEGSMDNRERLVPYLPEQVIKQVDLAAGEIRVEWDPEF